MPEPENINDNHKIYTLSKQPNGSLQINYELWYSSKDDYINEFWKSQGHMYFSSWNYHFLEPHVTILGGNTNIISITKIDIGHHIFIQNKSRYITEKDIYTLSNI